MRSKLSTIHYLDDIDKVSFVAQVPDDDIDEVVEKFDEIDVDCAFWKNTDTDEIYHIDDPVDEDAVTLMYEVTVYV